jgi:SPOR domain
MAAPINTPLAGEIWHLSIEDLFAPVQETQRLGGDGPFVINLSVSTAPITPTTKKFADCQDAHVYQIQVTEDGRPRYRLRLGPFTDEDQADAVLAEVRDLYPGALTATAIAADLRAIASLKPKTPPAKKPVAPAVEKAPVEVTIDLSAANSVLAFVSGSSPRPVLKPALPALQIVELPPVPEVPLELSPEWAIPVQSARVPAPPAPPVQAARIVAPLAPPVVQAARVVAPPTPAEQPARIVVPPVLPVPPAHGARVAPVLTEIAEPAPAKSIPVLTEMAVLKPKSPTKIIRAPAIVEDLEPPIATQPVQNVPAKPVPMVVEVFAPPIAKAPVGIPAVAEAAPPPKLIPVAVEGFAPKVTANPEPLIAQMRQLSKPVPVVLGVFAPIVKPTATSPPVREEISPPSKAAAPLAAAPVVAAPTVAAPVAPPVVAPLIPTVVAAPAAEVVPPPAKPIPVAAKAPVAPKHAQVAAKPRVPPKAAVPKMPNHSQSFAARPKIFAPKNAPSSKPGAGLTSLQHVASAFMPPPREVKELSEPLPNLESTQTIRALTTPELESEAASRWFVIQLSISDQAFDPDSVPNLDIFSEYRLYSVAGVDQGRTVHSLRLGFFTEEIAAVAVASYLGAYYDKPTIRRVSVAERERFNHQRVEARKDVGATGKHAVIEITGDLIARRKRTATSAKSDSSSQSGFQLNATPPR